MQKSQHCAGTQLSVLDTAVMIMGLIWHSPMPPICWLFAGLKQESGQISSYSKHEQFAIPHLGFNVHFREIAPVENDKEGKREHLLEITNYLEQAARSTGKDVHCEDSLLTHV